jgi:hypothetical protein
MTKSIPTTSLPGTGLAEREGAPRQDEQGTSVIEQLALLPADDLPVQLRLSQRTRRVGLAGVAYARAILAEQVARRREAEADAAHITPPQAA